MPRGGLLVAVALTGAPAWASGSVVGALSRDYDLAPGATATGTIEVAADADGWSIRVFQADFRTTATGREFPDAGTLPRSNAAWIRLPTGALDVAPDSVGTIPFSITLPENDTLAGTYWSVVMIETAPAAAELGRPGIRIVNRVAVRITTSVLGTGETRIEFGTDRVSARADDRTFETELTNVGDRMSATSVRLSLTGEDGTVVEAMADAAPLYPGCAATWRVPLPNLRPGFYSGLLVAEPESGVAYGKRVALSYDLWGAPQESP